MTTRDESARREESHPKMGISEEEWQERQEHRERERCPNCEYHLEHYICSEPEFFPRGLAESNDDFRRRRWAVGVRRAQEEAGLLRREDRALAQRLDTINFNLERLIDAVHGVKRATDVPARVFDLLEDIVEHLTGYRPKPRL